MALLQVQDDGFSRRISSKVVNYFQSTYKYEQGRYQHCCGATLGLYISFIVYELAMGGAELFALMSEYLTDSSVENIIKRSKLI